MCSITGQHKSGGSGEPCLKGTRNDNDLCSLKSGKHCAQLSASTTMPENFTPTFVYHRKTQRNPITNCMKPSNGCHSAISPETPSVAARELLVSASEHPSNTMPSSNGHLTRKEAGSEDVLKINGDQVLNACTADDNWSTSISSLELGSASLKTDAVDGGDSSSSGVSLAISGRDACISILRRHGLLDKILNRLPQHRVSVESTRAGCNYCYCLMRCKVCDCTESTVNMLVCDNCEGAFHVSCYNPHMMILPKGEWLCCMCLKKKHETFEDKSTGDMSSKIESNQWSTSEAKFGSLEFLFRDSEPYMSNVRIGDEFQAIVPDWCGPNNEESDLGGDPLERTPNNIDTKEQDSVKPLKLCSIGNWIQCQAVVEGIGEDFDGTVCGKWRRLKWRRNTKGFVISIMLNYKAPLFEVQTDDWECYRCILWDPARADCAVPQEVDTEEVVRQLKYIEMLKPQLAAKKRKTDHSAVDKTLSNYIGQPCKIVGSQP